MTFMTRSTLVLIAIFGIAVCLSGCCNTPFKAQQLGDDVHAYFLDGDPELLSEAQPDSAI